MLPNLASGVTCERRAATAWKIGINIVPPIALIFNCFAYSWGRLATVS